MEERKFWLWLGTSSLYLIQLTPFVKSLQIGCYLDRVSDMGMRESEVKGLNYTAGTTRALPQLLSTSYNRNEGYTQLPTGATWRHLAQSRAKYLSFPTVFFFFSFGLGFDVSAWEVCKNLCIIWKYKIVRIVRLPLTNGRQELRIDVHSSDTPLVSSDTHSVRLLRENHRTEPH